MSRPFVLSELRRILHIGQNRVEMPIVGASIRPAVGGCGHRISEKFGYLTEPLLFVFRGLQGVLLHEFGDLIWRVRR
jgi:hypothetical protein